MLGCSTGSRDKQDDFSLVWTTSRIGYYEEDSLNQARGYVIPRIVVKVEAVNLPKSKKLVVLPKDTTLRGHFFITFAADNQLDTVFLNEYLNPEELDIAEQEEGVDLVFEVNSTNAIDNLGSLSRKQLMEKIVSEGTLYHVSDTTNSRAKVIPKSRDFSVMYRDPNDTSVE
jgi:hypothetical protein